MKKSTLFFVASLLFGIVAVVMMILGIWVGDSRWHHTSIVLIASMIVLVMVGAFIES